MIHFLKIYKYYIILVLGISILLAIGLGLYVQNQINEQKLYERQLIETAHKKEEQAIKNREYLNELFNVYLNNFRKDLKKTAAEYRKSRRVLTQILSPDNFETPEIAKESYNFFNNFIAPDLRNKSAKTINIFTKYKNRLKEDIKNSKIKIGKEFFLKWQEMQKDQLNNYIKFFTKEEQIIQAYEEIIKFYYMHSNLTKYDDENNILLFKREEDALKEKELLDKIESLR